MWKRRCTKIDKLHAPVDGLLTRVGLGKAWNGGSQLKYNSRSPWPGTRFSKVPKTSRARKAICETTNRLLWKADLLTCFQANKRKITVRFEDLNPLRSWDTKGIVTPENGPSSFGTFEKRAPGAYNSNTTQRRLRRRREHHETKGSNEKKHRAFSIYKKFPEISVEISNRVKNVFHFIQVHSPPSDCDFTRQNFKNVAVNSLEVVRPFKSCKWNTHFYRKVSNGKTGLPFQKLRLFRKFSSGTNQKRAFHLHPNRNFRNFLVNGKHPQTLHVLHVRFSFWYISLLFSSWQRRELTKFQVV